MTKRAKNIALTEAATQRLEDTLTRISQIRHYYGEEESNRVAAEFASGFGRLISMGGTIAADGRYSFIAETASGMTVGLMYFAHDQRETVKKYNSKHGVAESSIDDLFSDEELASYPASGEWSLHS